MSDISIRNRYTYGGDDAGWIGGGGEDLEIADSITLDRTKFDLVSVFPNGFIPSGVCLGKIAATGLYGPYGGATSEVQTITVDAAGGTFTVAFDGSPASGAIAFNASAATVKAALEALSTINPGDVAVTGGPGAAGGGTPYTVTFGGRYIGQNVPALVTAAGSLTGGASTAAVATPTPGGSAVSDGREVAQGFLAWPVPYDRNSTGNLGAALLWRGEVVVAKLPTGHGLDASGQAALNKFRFV